MSTRKTGPSLPKPQLGVPRPDVVAAPEPAPAARADSGVPRGGFPVVGIGASAGGLAAIEAFFSGMPAAVDPGMAFVLVQHLAPDHKSILTELIRKYTRMVVREVEDGMPVEPNCVYIIPPNRNMVLREGALWLSEPQSPRGQRLPIDHFFRSLALDQRERAICVVLSGTGSDGTQGLQTVKDAGGMVLAQNPASAEYDGMPRSAIATGLVDIELPPAEMAAHLMDHVGHARGKRRRATDPDPAGLGDAAGRIFALLRAQTGHDFSKYKPSTTHRRIERRRAVQQIKSQEAYVKFLQQTPEEVEVLFGDLLIGVTGFFRDPKVFQFLETRILPELFAGKGADDPIRVWCVGCSSGEEAYSIAILLSEGMEALKRSFPIQIFATDIDPRAVAAARAGVFPAAIAAAVTPQRLARFFTPVPEGGAFRIHKSIRDMLVISEQSVIKDPPFSRLDLISCRNLLIYMGGELQRKVLSIFHYALNPGGILVLGSSETVGEFDELFDAEERKLKLFRRKELAPGPRPAAMLGLQPAPHARAAPGLAPAGRPASLEKVPLRETLERSLLQHLPLVAALVNGRGDVLYLHGRGGRYLEPAQGEAGTGNILKMAREGLRQDLTTALHLANTSGERVLCPGLRVLDHSEPCVVDLAIHPVAREGTAVAALFLVVLQPAAACGDPPPAGGAAGSAPPADSAARDLITALQQQLEAKSNYLHASFVELEAANDELQSSNEELQSVNEELQSVNEELATVNAELQAKVTDLSRANNDMNNLLAGTGIGMVFVDRALCIQRFTPAVTRIINLIQSDIGRPVGHIASNLEDYDSLVTDAKEVLDSLVPQEKEVRTRAGAWYAMRVLPYRTLENVIEGVAITFVDITDRKALAASVREKEIRLAEAIVATVREPLLVLDEELGVVLANRSYYAAFQTRAEDTVGRSIFRCRDGLWDLPALRRQLAAVLGGGSLDKALAQDVEVAAGRRLRFHARRIHNESGSSGQVLLSIEELPEGTNQDTPEASGAAVARKSSGRAPC